MHEQPGPPQAEHPSRPEVAATRDRPGADEQRVDDQVRDQMRPEVALGLQPLSRLLARPVDVGPVRFGRDAPGLPPLPAPRSPPAAGSRKGRTSRARRRPSTSRVPAARGRALPGAGVRRRCRGPARGSRIDTPPPGASLTGRSFRSGRDEGRPGRGRGLPQRRAGGVERAARLPAAAAATGRGASLPRCTVRARWGIPTVRPRHVLAIRHEPLPAPHDGALTSSTAVTAEDGGPSPVTGQRPASSRCRPWGLS